MTTRSTRRGLAAALALCTLVASPAGAAIQHEFSGSFTAQYVTTNFNNTAVTKDYAYAPDGLPAAGAFPGDFDVRLLLQQLAQPHPRERLIVDNQGSNAHCGSPPPGLGRTPSPR